MFLKSITYEEYPSLPTKWRLEQMHLGNINLIVGKNSSGKTRVINIINALGQIISGKLAPTWDSGFWQAEFNRKKGLATEKQDYLLNIKSRVVCQEKFDINDSPIMARDRTGVGFVLRKTNKERIKYKVPEDQLMAVVRRDEIQHPYFEHIHKWGKELCVYRFGGELGKGNFAIFENIDHSLTKGITISDHVESPVNIFKITDERFKDKYKKIVLEDLEELGYPCDDIGLVPVHLGFINGVPPLALAVKEKNLDCHTNQTAMSQGMYRAIALIVQINANIFWTQSMMVGREMQEGDSPMVVIDDIGEGLDYERSKNLINILIKKALDHKFQLVMSTNDRFVMNDVPLEYWTILNRVGNTVDVVNKVNTPKIFEEFKYYGLNNFDFFSGGHFLNVNK